MVSGITYDVGLAVSFCLRRLDDESSIPSSCCHVFAMFLPQLPGVRFPGSCILLSAYGHNAHLSLQRGVSTRTCVSASIIYTSLRRFSDFSSLSVDFAYCHSLSNAASTVAKSGVSLSSIYSEMAFRICDILSCEFVKCSRVPSCSMMLCSLSQHNECMRTV